MRQQRRNFLVNPRFQLRFAFFMSSLVVGLSLMFLLLINEAFRVITSLLIRDPQGPDVEKVLQAKHELLTTLYLSEGLFVVALFVLAIFLSHRIAGPLYKLNQTFLDAARTGKLKANLQFRSTDHFQELAENYNAMVTAVQGASSADLKKSE